MKSKIFLAAALFVFSSVSSFAATEKNQVPGNVVSAFNSDFSGAGKVTWETGTGYYKAGFIESGIVCYAFYTAAGELMGMGRQLTTDMIPVALGKEMKKMYPAFMLSEVYEMNAEKSGDYLFVLTNGNQVIKLRSSADLELVAVK